MQTAFWRRKIVWFSLVYGLFLVGILLISWQISYQRGVEELRRKSSARLALYVNNLQGLLGKYQTLPRLLAMDSNLVRALSSPYEKQRIQKLNRYLFTINTISDALDTYLMNRDGLTIAASNWSEPRPFVGRNFSYRPYFQEAMRGRLGRYFALGATSSRRGYYFAYPVRNDSQIIGAVVVKISVDSVEEHWSQTGESFVVTDPDGIIFITTHPGWRYKTLEPIHSSVQKRIIDSRRYPETSFVPISSSGVRDSDGLQFIDIKDDAEQEISLLKQSTFMSEAGWNVHLLTDTAEVERIAFADSLVVGAVLLVLYILGLLLVQRYNRLKALALIEEQTRIALRDANEQLESRVVMRTKELTAANQLLTKEVLERKETETKLKRTRKELIHAAKLAVLGQISAGINHELNQPLAAIRSYTDNGRQYLKKGRFREAMWNMEQIAELTERMAQVGAQLKLFSKKSSGQIARVPVQGAVDGAMEIIGPAFKKAGVKIDICIEPPDIKVRANNVLLQQVLVNLFSNAMHAMDGQAEKKISFLCTCADDEVLIVVEDTGSGIVKEHVKNIFEPFYTTKKSGQGLGLGLTISERIIRDFGGRILYVPLEKGARFECILSRVG